MRSTCNQGRPGCRSPAKAVQLPGGKLNELTRPSALNACLVVTLISPPRRDLRTSIRLKIWSQLIFDLKQWSIRRCAWCRQTGCRDPGVGTHPAAGVGPKGPMPDLNQPFPVDRRGTGAFAR